MWKYTLNKHLATLDPDWIDKTRNVINGFRRLYWSEIPTKAHLNNYKKLIYDRPFETYQISTDNKAIEESFAIDNDKIQREYFLECKQEMVFSPKYGWAMTRKGEIILDSLPYTYYALLPGFRDYLNAVYPPSSAKTFDEIVSFRDVGDANYFHFYNDHLTKLVILKERNLDDVPILVSSILYSKPYFQEAIERSGLQNRAWIVQNKEYVIAKRSYFFGCMPATKEYFDRVLTMLKPPKPKSNTKRRVFINRERATGRCIANLDEIEMVLSEFDFETVYIENFTLHQQMELFSEAETVVGIHGAGMINIIFRAGAPLNVIEIFPPNNIPAMFYWISYRYGFKYDAIVGYQKVCNRADRQPYAKIDFYVDPVKLRDKVIAAIKN